MLFYASCYCFYSRLFRKKRILCKIIMPSNGDAIPDFKHELEEPERQYLVYEYEYNGIKRLQYSQCRFKNANKYINRQMVLYHDSDDKNDYLYIDVMRMHKLSQIVIRYFGLFCLVFDMIYLIIMLLHLI